MPHNYSRDSRYHHNCSASPDILSNPSPSCRSSLNLLATISGRAIASIERIRLLGNGFRTFVVLVGLVTKTLTTASVLRSSDIFTSEWQPLYSRFFDPNHPANSGSLISLLTGGAANPTEGRRNSRITRRENRNDRRDTLGSQEWRARYQMRSTELTLCKSISMNVSAYARGGNSAARSRALCNELRTISPTRIHAG